MMQDFTSDQINKFILDNYQNMNDEEIGKYLGLSPKTIYHRRFRMKIHFKKSIKQNSTIAEILELFTSGITIAEVARKIRKRPSVVSNIINKHYFPKQRGYNTVTLVLESKINYE